MKLKGILSIGLAVVLAMGVRAGVNRPTAEGFAERGRLLLSVDAPSGALTQSQRAITLGNDVVETELTRALGAYHAWDSDAAELLDSYLKNHPAGEGRYRARLALANIDFEEGKFQEALAAYNELEAGRFGASDLANLEFHCGYCLLMVGETVQADEAFGRAADDPRYSNASQFYRAYIQYVNGNYAEAFPMMERVNTTEAPGDAAPYYLMEMLFARGEYLKALTMAERLMKEKGNEAYQTESLRIAGESAHELGRREESMVYLGQYIDRAEQAEGNAYYLLGMSEYELGHNQQAINLMQRAAQLGSGAMKQSAYLYLGLAYQATGDKDAALMAFEQAWLNDVDAGIAEEAFYNYMLTRTDGGRVPFGNSLSLYRQFLEKFPRSRHAGAVREYVAEGYILDDDLEGAIAFIKGIEEPTERLKGALRRATFMQGVRNYESGHYAAAARQFEEIAGKPSAGDDLDLQSMIRQGDALFRLEDYAGAAKSYRNYLGRVPRNDSNRGLGLYDLGYALFKQRDYAGAERNFAEAVKGNSGAWLYDALNRLGDARYYQRRFGDAVTAYRRAREANPEAGDYALLQEGMSQGMLSNYKEKIRLLERLEGTYPNSPLLPQALLETAETMMAIGDTGGALRAYNRLIEEHYTTAAGRNGYLQLALTYQTLGRDGEAEEAYKEVIRRYPTSEEAEMASRDLRQAMAGQNRLGEYMAFMESVDGAPKPGEDALDDALYEAAERRYMGENDASLLKEYREQYPEGRHLAQALDRLTESASAHGDNEEVIEYANEFAARYPDSGALPEVLLRRAEAERESGKQERALRTYEEALERASEVGTRYAALRGILETAGLLQNHERVIATADEMLGTTSTPTEDLDEIHYRRAVALEGKGDFARADEEFGKLAENPRTEYGAKSAVALGQSQLNRGLLKQAQGTVDELINSNTPQRYELARGFILYSDILRRQGNEFEADEYLRSLRSNYPGDEADIRRMIDERLKD